MPVKKVARFEWIAKNNIEKEIWKRPDDFSIAVAAINLAIKYKIEVT